MSKRYSILIMLSIVSTTVASAQQRDMSEFQVSLITPLGTNGWKSDQVINKYSLNIVSGYSAGLDGVEIGGIGNIELRSVRGAQFAGCFNWNNGISEGAVQIGGLVNHSAHGNGHLQLAGLWNDGDRTNYQISGFINKVNSADVQVSGFINIAKNISTVQIGFINIADSIEGIPVGFLNIVRKGGYSEGELSFSDALHSAVTLKLGVSRLYMIYSLAKNYSTDFNIALGCGIGTKLRLGEDSDLSFELLAYSMTNKNIDLSHSDLLIQCKTLYAIAVDEHVAFSVGPILNITSAQYHPTEKIYSRLSAPYSLYDRIHGMSRVTGWIGIGIGLQIR